MATPAAQAGCRPAPYDGAVDDGTWDEDGRIDTGPRTAGSPVPTDAAPTDTAPTDAGLRQTVAELLADQLATLEHRLLIIEDGLRAIWERLDSVDHGLLAVQASLVASSAEPGGAAGLAPRAGRSSDAVALLRQIAAESDAAPGPAPPEATGGRHFRGSGTT
jgi:hypothetical protein